MPTIDSYETYHIFLLEHIMNLITNSNRESYSRDEVLVILGAYRDDPQWLEFMRKLDGKSPQPPEDSKGYEE
jgi:hypothetical protein